jgi:hypothetical protein
VHLYPAKRVFPFVQGLRSHAVVFVAATGMQALQAAAQGRRRRATGGGAAASSGAWGEVSRDAGRGARAGAWRAEVGPR